MKKLASNEESLGGVEQIYIYSLWRRVSGEKYQRIDM